MSRQMDDLAEEQFGVFEPCVIEHKQLGLTEMLLEDTTIIWEPHRDGTSHDVDLGYSLDGRLIGIKIWRLAALKEKSDEHS